MVSDSCTQLLSKTWQLGILGNNMCVFSNERENYNIGIQILRNYNTIWKGWALWIEHVPLFPRLNGTTEIFWWLLTIMMFNSKVRSSEISPEVSEGKHKYSAVLLKTCIFFLNCVYYLNNNKQKPKLGRGLLSKENVLLGCQLNMPLF